MNFKRFHESKNLFDKDNADTYQAYFTTTDNWTATTSDSISVKIACEASTQYTLSIPISESGSIFRIYESNDINVVPTSANPPMLTRIIRAETTKTYTFTTSATAECIVFQGAYSQRNVWLNGLMFNEGEYKPYEPYSAEVWHDSHYIKETATDTITTLPATIYPLAQTATVGLKGNTTQNGTPTPDNPIMPEGTGEKTAQLFDENYPNIKVDTPTYRSIYVGDGTFTLSTTTVQYRSTANLFFLAGNIGSGASTQNNGIWNGNPRTVTAVDGYVTIAYRYYIGDETSDPRSNDVMLNLGSTALPYEPYGYKIPISSGGTTTPVYLGQVQSERKIGKIELTGQENFTYSSISGLSRFGVDLFQTADYQLGLCSHYNYQFYNADGNVYHSSTNTSTRVYFIDNTYNSDAEFKVYLAQQYANGTPVTVYYVLAAPETAVVNEPLMKIGTYADSISGISIPTTAGANTLDVQITVKPSEVTANYSGWHPVSAAHERESGAWD